MDAIRFDRFMRWLKDGSTRRAVLACGLGGALATCGLGDAGARKKRRRRKTCKKKRIPCQRCKHGKWKPTAGLACGDGGACLANGSCALTCTVDDECDQLGSGCNCSPPSAEGVSHCYGHVNSCEEIPQVCDSTADCPLGQVCQPTGCGANNYRCWPLCAA